MAAPLKDQIGPASVSRLGRAVAAVEPGFPLAAFEGAAVRGLDDLELKARIDAVAGALGDALPGEFAAAAEVLEAAVASAPGLGVWDVWPATVWAGQAGTGHVERAAGLLAALTPLASGEFGIRPLIDADPERMAAILRRWAGAGDAHVRRLASEGPRPLLPWAPRLRLTAATPGWGLPVLDRLTRDPFASVRRSVANHLNDVAKLDPELALATAARWQSGPGPGPAEGLLAHGLRTLTRRGDRAALALCGLDLDAEVTVRGLAVSPAAVRTGETVQLDFGLHAAGSAPVVVTCGYTLEFARPSGRPARALFTLGSTRLAPGESRQWRRRYTFRAMTTRQYHPGTHAVQVMVNGQPMARTEFLLEA